MKLQNKINRMEKSIVKTFFEIVKIDSPSGYEDNVREYLKDWLDGFGVKANTDGAGNLFAKFDGVGEPLILCAHMDTVEPGRGVNPIVEDGVIKSKGDTILGADNKVAVAAIMEAINSSDPKKRHPLEVIFSVCEETYGGINKFNFSKLKAKTGIVADASFPIGHMVVTSPWIVELKIEVIGKAAHAGFPELGKNALNCVTKCISQLEWGRIDKKTTANIGLIEGGSATNTIPKRISMQGEVRSFSEKKLKKQIALIRRKFEEEAKKDGLKLKFVANPYCQGYLHRTQSSAVKLVKKAVKKTGLKFGLSKTFGGSDANSYCAKGITVIDLGDGTKHSHTVRETVSVKSLVDLTKVIANYISVD